MHCILFGVRKLNSIFVLNEKYLYRRKLLSNIFANNVSTAKKITMNICKLLFFALQQISNRDIDTGIEIESQVWKKIIQMFYTAKAC